MKSIFNKTLGVLLISVMLIGISACSKDKADEGDEWLGDSYVSMKINGELWKSDMGMVATLSDTGDDDIDNYYIVTLIGIKGEGNGEDQSLFDEEVETISIGLLIPESKFNNPEGSYAAGGGEFENPVLESAIVFSRVNGETVDNVETYYSVDHNSEEKAMGRVQISSSKIGNQAFLGEEGYTNISGTFEAELYQYSGEGETPKKLTITEGKFNLSPSPLGMGMN